MIGVQPIQMNKNKAKRLWQEHCDLLKTTQAKDLEDLKTLYYHLSKGKKIIDIFEAFKYAGKNEKDEPRLAIARANLKKVRFTKEKGGQGYFSEDDWNQKMKNNVRLPEGTFSEWKLNPNGWIEKDRLSTELPTIPARHTPAKSDLKNFFVLWEVEKWDVIPKDPFILRRITNNLFVVEGHWNLTKLEQALMRGKK